VDLETTDDFYQTSGASMIGDWPVTGDRTDTKTYSNIGDNIFEIERDFPESHSPVRKVNQLVVGLGEKEGVKTHIVAPPLICKFSRPQWIFKGENPSNSRAELRSRTRNRIFTLGFGQVHMMVQLALKNKQSVMIGIGSGVT
jgi:hypothetical protein